MMPWFFWLSFAALLVTKAADVVSTWRHVGVRGETNPIARPLFAKFGLGWGMFIVCLIYLVVAGGQYLLVWWTGRPLMLWCNGALGFLIAWVQWDAARFNATGKPSAMIKIAIRGHARWAQYLQRRGERRGTPRRPL
jgi:hypothetical protein